jgi:hypothetical protein
MWKFVENIVHRWQGGVVKNLPDGGQEAHVERIKDNKHFIRRDYAYNENELLMRTTDTLEGVGTAVEVRVDKKHHKITVSYFDLEATGVSVRDQVSIRSHGLDMVLEDALRRAMADGSIKGSLHALRCLQDGIQQSMGDGEIDRSEAKYIDSLCKPLQRKKLPASHER